jgi:hypothetical protein
MGNIRIVPIENMYFSSTLMLRNVSLLSSVAPKTDE